MLVHRFWDPKLAQAGYLIGCSEAREALVIDATRDIDQYLAHAAALNLRIAHVTETHIHADFVSGSRELAATAGAKLYLSDEGGTDWRYDFAASDSAVGLLDGGGFTLGRVGVTVHHTPGHTPEHLTFLITDGAAATEPIAAVTGDFVFVGDVGRPDLLERAARVEGTAESAARTLFRSVQRFKSQPDYLQIWPGHGAGSACGKGLSAIPQSTVGYERRFNWAFAVTDEAEFVRLVLEGQPDPPRYFGTMKRINKEGPRALGGPPRPVPLPAERVAEVLDRGELVVDMRSSAEFATGHLPGSINIPFNNWFTTWAGWVVPYDRDVYLFSAKPDGRQSELALRDLAMIGLDRVAGSFGLDALGAWTHAGRSLASFGRISARELAQRLDAGTAVVVDVRSRAEWEAGHIPGVVNIPAGEIEDRIGDLPQGRPLVVHCQGGTRSAIAASLLNARGMADVLDMPGGFTEWEGTGLPVARDEGSLADLVIGPLDRVARRLG
ncbi:MAG: MBL fold metallo-hydrolase [Gemmatimonadales bacterium]|nr:MBL fold metallo-hydrolase [Gemmatimonadales bacterium]